MRKAILSPITGILAAILSLITLSVAVQTGQVAALVTYGIGISIGGILSIVFAGGSALAFITGNEATQAAVRSLRVRFVIPCSVLTTALASWLYATFFGFSALEIFLAGAIAIVNVSSEIESSFLRRKLRTVSILMIEVFSRALSLVLVLVGVEFILAILMGATLRYICLSVVSWNDPSRKASLGVRLKDSFGSAVRPSLLSSSLLYVVLDRLIFILLPLMVAGPLAGYFVAIMSGQQAIAGALASGLHTSMASRAESHIREQHGSVTSWHRRFELLVVAVSVFLAGLGLLLHGVLLAIIGIPVVPDVQFIWVAVLIAMPFGTAARVTQYVLLSEGASSKALISIASAVIASLIISAVSFSIGEWRLILVGLAVAELLALVVGLMLLFARKPGSLK